MRKRQQAKGAWLFLAPFLILFTLFVLAPVLYGFWISLHNWHILSKDAFSALPTIMLIVVATDNLRLRRQLRSHTAAQGNDT